MRNRVLKAAALAGFVPALALAQQPPVRQSLQPAAQPAQRGAAVGGPEAGAISLGIQPSIFIARDEALFGYLSSRVALAGDAPDRYVPGAAIMGGYSLTPQITVGAGLGFGTTSGLTLIQPTVGASYTFSPANRLSPFAVVSAGASMWSGDGPAEKATGIGGHGAVGVRYMIQENLAVRAEGRVGYESYGDEDFNAIVGRAGIGIGYTLGSRRVLTSVAVTPGSATLTSQGQTQQLSAVARDQRGNPMTGRTFRFTSSNPAVATVSATGLVTARSNGTATISTAAEGVTGTATITVARRAATVAVSPTTGSLNALGATQQFSATARDANNGTIEGASITWSSSNSSVATVSPTGLATAAGNGTAQITATSGGRTASATVTVAQTTASVSITPATASLTVGSTAQLGAQALDANRRPITGKMFTWTSEAPTVATVSTAGVATGLATGTARVTATADGRSGSASLNVTAAAAPRAGEEVWEELTVTGRTRVITGVGFVGATARPTPASTAPLNALARMIRSVLESQPNARFEVGGHTDNRGPIASNRRIATARAQSVVAVLTRQGVPAAALTSVGHGPDRPLVPNTTPANMAQNRRVDIRRVN